MNNRKFLMVLLLLILAFVLTGCNSSIYEQPIGETSGWFQTILVNPIAWLMYNSGKIFGSPSIFGLGIIFTTLAVRTLAWPIYAKSNDLQIKMSVAQPEMNRIQQKYIARKDPESQRKMQQELMGVYKKYGINFWGCLMPFLQMPIFIAMYQVVRRIVIENGTYQDINQMFLGIDLSKSSDLPGIIMALIVGATMFLLQKIATKKPAYTKNIPAKALDEKAEQMQKTMKMMTYVMVGMMVFISLSSNALALYWIIGNFYSLGQTLLNRKLGAIKFEKIKENDILG